MPNHPLPATPAGHFAARLTKAMDDAGWPVRGRGARLKRRFGVSQPTVSGWLNGQYMPDAAKVRLLAEDLATPFEALYFGRIPRRDGPGLNSAPAADVKEESLLYGLSERESTLVHNFRACGEEAKKVIEAAAAAGRLPSDSPAHT